MTDPILEMTRRDLIRTFVAMGAVFVLPLTARAQGSTTTLGNEAALPDGMRNRFGRIVVGVGNLELNDQSKSIGMAEIGMVQSYKEEASVVGDCLSAWVSDIHLDDVSLKTGFKGDPNIEYISVNNPKAYTVMKDIVDEYDTTFLPLVTGLTYGKVMTGTYPTQLNVGGLMYEVDQELNDIWSYGIGTHRTPEASRIDVKGPEFNFYHDDVLRMAVEIPLQKMQEVIDSFVLGGDKQQGKTDVGHLMVLMSGGPDSATAVAEARRLHPNARITPLYLQFGHEQDEGELSAFSKLVEQFGLETPEVVDMRGVRQVLSGRVLIHSGAAIMPFGNALVLTFALAYAARAGIEEIWVGMHADDVRESHEYSRGYFDRLQRLAEVTAPKLAPRLVTPFINFDKVSIFRHGASLGVDYGQTWSCIRGTTRHCGKCGACLARQRAFSLAGISDTTEYAETLPLTAVAS